MRAPRDYAETSPTEQQWQRLERLRQWERWADRGLWFCTGLVIGMSLMGSLLYY